MSEINLLGMTSLSYVAWVGNPLLKTDVFERGIIFKTTESRHKYLMIKQLDMGDGQFDLVYSTVQVHPISANDLRWQFLNEYVLDFKASLLAAAIRAWMASHDIEEDKPMSHDHCLKVRWVV